ncbi:MAG: DUF5778 family protein [Halobacteriaceae archaeon]
MSRLGERPVSNFMADIVDSDLYRRVVALLEPGDISLCGAVIHTQYRQDEESLLYQDTIQLGEIIATVKTDKETYVYAGNDDPDFGINQYQGLTIDEDNFVWECQHILRDDTYDIIFYWEDTGDQTTILNRMRQEGYEVIGVTEDGSIKRNN